MTSLLRVDALFLTVAGLFGLASDLSSYVAGSGPFGATFHRDATVIGVVEAHALALLIALTLWRAARQDCAFGHLLALSAHAVLGLSNIIWFDVFVRVQAEAQGIAVTVVHLLLVVLNAFARLRSGGGGLRPASTPTTCRV